MKKDKIIMFFLLITLILTFTGCKTESNNKEENGIIEEENSIKDNDDDLGEDNNEDIQIIYSDNIINWAVPDIYSISDLALSKINKRIIDLGYDFSLQMIPIDFSNYHNELESNNLSLDIALTGFNTMGGIDKNLELIKSGYYAPLDEFLDTSEGDKLLELYDEKLWESVKVDREIFIIPNGVVEDSTISFAFNKTYVEEEDLKDFTGDLSELKKYMEDIPFQEDFTHIIYTLSEEDLFNLINSEHRYGLLLSYDNRQAYNPYEYGEFRDLINLFHDYYSSQYINHDFSLIGGNQKADDYTEYLESGNFFVYITRDKTELSDLNADLIIYERPAYIQARINGTGIVASSEKKEEAFQLLQLAYTDEELANLLVYGVEGVDYKIEDGRVYTLGGGIYHRFANQLSLGIYEMTYPNGEEDFEINRLEDKKNYYENKVKASPFLGFHYYNQDQTPIISNLEEIVKSNLNIYKSDHIDEEFDRVNEELKAQGIDELLIQVNEAIDKHFEQDEGR